jgi:ribosome recycling factor
MSTQDWAGFILTILSIGTIILGGIRWYIKVQVDPIKEAVEDIRKETKTNGGSSMRDEIKQIKKEQEHARDKRQEQKEKLDHLYDLFVEYISRQK